MPVVATNAGRVRGSTTRVIALVLIIATVFPPGAMAAEPSTPAPAIALPLLQSKEILQLEDLRGRVVLLDFWASWCGPCRESLPQYQKLRDEYPRADFEVLAVSLDEDIKEALGFLKQVPLQFPLLHDPEGKVASAYALKGMPSSYLIDRNGILRSQHVGFTMKDLPPLRAKIEHLIAEKADAN
jgi:cytochrome c biogenesis protein CcmG, thiol:disulfide interchange protein DsbE